MRVINLKYRNKMDSGNSKRIYIKQIVTKPLLKIKNIFKKDF